MDSPALSGAQCEAILKPRYWVGLSGRRHMYTQIIKESNNIASERFDRTTPRGLVVILILVICRITSARTPLDILITQVAGWTVSSAHLLGFSPIFAPRLEPARSTSTVRANERVGRWASTHCLSARKPGHGSYSTCPVILRGSAE